MSSPTHIDYGRRALLRGRLRASPSLRPPWSLPEPRFSDLCSCCQACIDSCPEGIIIADDGGFPTLDFQRGECTFCRRCVDACPEPVFLDPERVRPWDRHATIRSGCLTRQGIVCQNCRDHCDAGAIRFEYRAGRIPQPRVAVADCSGCGACVAVCPSAAIEITEAT